MISWFVCNFIKLFSFGLSLLPLRTALWLGRRIGELCYFLHKRKWVAYANLRAAMPGKYTLKEMKQIVFNTYQGLGATFVEFLLLPYLDAKYFEKYTEIDEESYDRVKRVVDQGKSFIFLGAHLGNWELAANFVKFCWGVNLKIIFTDQKNTKINNFMNGIRESHGNEMIGRGMPLREILAALKENASIGIVADQAGGEDDVYLEFFGRKASTHSGPFRIGKKNNTVIFPYTFLRKNKHHHVGKVFEPVEFPDTGDPEKDVLSAMQEYLRLLEYEIEKDPSQWLWGHKRWKYSMTKKVTILTDGKMGHMNQSHAIFEWLKKSIPPHKEKFRHMMQFDLQVVPIRFKNNLLRRLFSIFAWMLIPFSRGNCEWVRFFLEPRSYKAFIENYGDFIISCGSQLIPFNVMLRQENNAKSILLMKPAFPLNLFNFDLIVAPVHDRVGENDNVVSTLLTPNLIRDDFLKEQSNQLKEKFYIPREEKTICFLVGGDTKNYHYQYALFEETVKRLKSFVQANHYKILVTNSRRTRTDITTLLKNELEGKDFCNLFIDVNQKNPKNAVYGMMGHSDIILVTEDSVSMISEAIQSRRKVFVIKPSHDSLAKKHVRFHQTLREKGLIENISIDRLASQLTREDSMSRWDIEIKKDQEKIQEKLQRLL